MTFPNPRTDQNSSTNLEFINAFVLNDVLGTSLVAANLDREEVRLLIRLKLGDAAAGQVINVIFDQASPPATIFAGMTEVETALDALNLSTDNFTADLGFIPTFSNTDLVGALWTVARAAIVARDLIGTPGYK